MAPDRDPRCRLLVVELPPHYEVVLKMSDEAFETQVKTLKKRLKEQRKELRRLNRYVEIYWHGFRRGMEVSDTCELRGKMIKAFGNDAVRKAEGK